MTTICVASLVRNERDRWLPAVLKSWQQFADEVVILDDGSTDETASYCEAAGCAVIRRSAEQAWGAESSARAELWQYAAATGCDWIFFEDADMAPASSPRSLFEAPVDAIAFRLYDLWSQNEGHLFYREDAYWHAHKVPRVWAVRNPGPQFDAEWSGRGIHSGHLPQNLTFDRVALAPAKMSIMHLGYLRPADRVRKAASYERVGAQLTPHEAAHAASILDTDPRLLHLPFPCFEF